MYFKLRKHVSFKPANLRKHVVFWLKNSYIPLLEILTAALRGGVRVFLTLLTGSEAAVALLNVGLSAEGPIVQASRATTPALYARTLRNPSREDFQESLKLFMFFSGFIYVTFIALSGPIASLYNPKYVEAQFLIPIIATYALIVGLIGIYSTALLGASREDVEEHSSRKKIVKSYLFKLPFIGFLGAILTYIVLSLALIFIRNNGFLEALVASFSLLVGVTSTLPYLVHVSRRSSNCKFPLREFLNILISSVLAGLWYFVSKTYAIVVTEFWKVAPTLLVHVGLAVLIYLASLALISKWFRSLVKAVLHTVFR